MNHRADHPGDREMPVAKTCTRCWTRRWIGQYSPRPAARDGHQSWCKTCMRAIMEEYRQDHGERVRATKARSYRRRHGSAPAEQPSGDPQEGHA